MDPITVAGAYATIVGLMCAFKNQKKGREDQAGINSYLGLKPSIART